MAFHQKKPQEVRDWLLVKFKDEIVDQEQQPGGQSDLKLQIGKCGLSGGSLADRDREGCQQLFGDVFGIDVYNKVRKELDKEAKEAESKEAESKVKKQRTDDPLLSYFQALLLSSPTEYKAEYTFGGETGDVASEVLDITPTSTLQGNLQPSKVIIRDCFSELASLILECPYAMLWGASGVGKSTFLDYFVTYLRDSGVPKVYLGIQKTRTDIVLDLVQRTVSLAPESEIELRILLGKDSWAILDSKDGPSLACHYLFVSSPTQTSDRKTFPQMVKQYVTEKKFYFVMPEWEWEELMLLQTVMKPFQEDFLGRYELMGGIPRKLLAVAYATPSGTPTEAIMAQIKSLDFSKLKEMVHSMMSGQAIPEQFNGNMVQIREENFRYAGLRYTSDAVRDQIVKEWQKKSKEDLTTFIKSAGDDPTASGLAGHLFESLAHQQFERIGHSIELKGRVLGTDASCNRTVVVKEVASRTPFNRPGAFKVAASAKEDCYYRPCVGNLPAFDAFIIQQNELLLLQFTVAKAHSVQGDFLVKFVNAVLVKHKGIQTVSLAFVSEKARKLAGIQTYKKAKKVPPKDTQAKQEPLQKQDIEKKFVRQVVLRQFEFELSEF